MAGDMRSSMMTRVWQASGIKKSIVEMGVERKIGKAKAPISRDMWHVRNAKQNPLKLDIRFTRKGVCREVFVCQCQMLFFCLNKSFTNSWFKPPAIKQMKTILKKDEMIPAFHLVVFDFIRNMLSSRGLSLCCRFGLWVWSCRFLMLGIQATEMSKTAPTNSMKSLRSSLKAVWRLYNQNHEKSGPAQK